ncbi:MAG TPA: DUF4623 domain-containing protein [Lacipirellula sp.]
MINTMIRYAAACAVALAATASTVHAAFILQPKTSFGGGDGWLAPAEATHLQGASLQRGLTYNATNNHLYLVDRNGGSFIRILDGTTGALLGSLDMTGVSGGTFAINMIDVDDSGVIYAANLTTDTDSASPFKVYRWATEASAPTVAYDSIVSPIANGADIRTGDSFAVIGSGANTRLVAGASAASAAGNPGDNAFVLLTTGDGLSYSATVQDFVGTEPPNGVVRLGIDFIDADTIIGRQATGTEAIVADFAGNVATQVALAELNNSNESILAIDRANSLLATAQINTSDVRLYDIADPDNPVLLDTKNLTTAFVANGNGTGDLKFGNGMLYVLNTNNGIQAFNVVPEPAVMALLAGAAVVFAAYRRRLKEAL